MTTPPSIYGLTFIGSNEITINPTDKKTKNSSVHVMKDVASSVVPFFLSAIFSINEKLTKKSFFMFTIFLIYVQLLYLFYLQYQKSSPMRHRLPLQLQPQQ